MMKIHHTIYPERPCASFDEWRAEVKAAAQYCARAVQSNQMADLLRHEEEADARFNLLMRRMASAFIS